MGWHAACIGIRRGCVCESRAPPRVEPKACGGRPSSKGRLSATPFHRRNLMTKKFAVGQLLAVLAFAAPLTLLFVVRCGSTAITNRPDRDGAGITDVGIGDGTGIAGAGDAASP